MLVITLLSDTHYFLDYFYTIMVISPDIFHSTHNCLMAIFWVSVKLITMVVVRD